MKTISAVISAWNEESKIERCLKSVQWVDEIILIDNESTDKTRMIGEKLKARVLVRPNNPMLNVNKNYGFEKAKGDWILNLDADEVIPESLAVSIRKAMENEDLINGFWIPRKNILFGKWIRHGLWWPDKQLRLFRKNKGKFPCVHVHEYLEVDGQTAEFDEPFVHFNYESVSQYLRKMDTIYTQSEVKRLLDMKYTLSWTDAIRFPVSDFLKIYFAQKGYKDGLHGLVLSLLQAFYSFVVFAKLWEKKGFTEFTPEIADVHREMRRSAGEYNFWFYTTIIGTSKTWIKVLHGKLLRKLYGKS